MGDSLQSNPPTANIHITSHAANWLWFVFAMMLLSTFGAIIWAHSHPRGQRAFHYISIVILTTASLAYFSMASDLGQTAVVVEFARDGDQPGTTRNVFYVRYIQWFINGPLIILMVLLTTGVALSEIFLTIFMTIVVVITGLVGALVPSTYKWGYYTMGVFALFYVFFQLLWSGSRSRFHAGADYAVGTGYITFVWILYPLVWALCEGGNVISPTGEMVWYGLLDMLAAPIFLFTHLSFLESVDYNTLGLQSGKNSDYAAGAAGGAVGGAVGAGAATNAGGGNRDGGAGNAAEVDSATGVEKGQNPANAPGGSV